jgi:two-component system sensor histidine kinase CreC
LSAIRGAAELLAEPMDTVRRERFVRNIQSESLRIQTIVDRMLELSALENRKKLMKSEPVSLRALTTTLIESLELSLVRKSLLVRLEIDDNLPMITGDPFLLHQAIGNLLQNAIDFSPAGGGITIRAVRHTSGLRLEVIDAGTGIADFARDRIFEKFFSLQRPDSGEKSTGLGLNFVRQVALLHGGTVFLENNQDKGATAVLELPV